ncbi:hypothetical protein CCHR01_00646 [Colletotrichum chrysophilum]|uniref:Uncharacterized protein n=1 Tax=Colletotrichum chrysophilum TaxID=1836956 RepID=A0AAD9AY32_9PEZI|nr:hypothetical protein CCHR01_00646 [Colletotrichum chrysophilum]
MSRECSNERAQLPGHQKSSLLVELIRYQTQSPSYQSRSKSRVWQLKRTALLLIH